jgi:HAMP domain-containing protein
MRSYNNMDLDVFTKRLQHLIHEMEMSDITTPTDGVIDVMQAEIGRLDISFTTFMYQMRDPKFKEL